ncbi:MAG TPA: imidazolonepropionase [Flavobacteriales bacterium]|nr:imidazolonepropionase [Flavobacteriales bacterium]HRJ39857.1 imidazolonepropionase [Flavobacteriales bacterium]
MKMLIKNIRQLVQVRDVAPERLSGPEMKILPVIENAWLAIEDGIIADYGSMNDWPGISDWRDLEVVDADGRIVLPAWIDSHTHLVYAGSREGEFVDRINGLSYEDIAARGGGILNSSKRLAETGEEELYESAMQRLMQLQNMGTGAVEIKSGYGLTLETELKILRVIRRLKSTTDLTIKSTFLGAHAFPLAYKENKQGYIDHLINEMLPAVAAEKLADYCDVFCERNYFSEEQTITILEAAKKHGMIPKVHANQLSRSGGVQAGVKVGAVSVDHLEYVDQEEIAALRGSKTMATLLPGAQWFLSLPHPPARRMIDSGLAVAIASDYNPGSSPSGNMALMLSMACVQYNMTPEEAINAATINAAYAMGISSESGSISPGKIANLIITEKIPGYAFIPYAFGMNVNAAVMIKGKIVSGTIGK